MNQPASPHAWRAGYLLALLLILPATGCDQAPQPAGAQASAPKEFDPNKPAKPLYRLRNPGQPSAKEAAKADGKRGPRR